MLYKVWDLAAQNAGISEDTLFVSTGIVRPAKEGEWYLAENSPFKDLVVRASRDHVHGLRLILRPYTQKHNRDSKGRFIKGDGAEKSIPAPRIEPNKRSWWQKLRGK